MLHSRKKRVECLIQQEVADIIENMKDPRLGMITVSSVELTKDLRIATIFLTVLQEELRKQSLEILENAKKFIRHELGNRIIIKYLPEIRFRYDETLDRMAKIDSLLSKIKNDDAQESSEEKTGSGEDESPPV